MKTMTAKLPEQPLRNGKNYADTKALVAAFSLVAADTIDGSPIEVAVVRWYRASGGNGTSPLYCTIWVAGRRRRGFVYSGTGVARGYGYHKRSSALANALGSAGISLSTDIDGAGSQACQDAVTAIARALGYQNTIITEH